MTRAAGFAMLLTLATTMCSQQPMTFYNPNTGATEVCSATDIDPLGDQCVATLKSAGWTEENGPVIVRDKPPRTAPDL
jgi:hypothetical protein